MKKTGRKLASVKDIDLSSEDDSDSDDYESPKKGKGKPVPKRKEPHQPKIATKTPEKHVEKTGMHCRSHFRSNCVVTTAKPQGNVMLGGNTLITSSQMKEINRKLLSEDELTNMYKEVVELSSGNVCSDNSHLSLSF
jgi:hypothetical protein